MVILELSTFLKIGFTIAYFKRSGNLPVSNDWFTKKANGFSSKCADSLRTMDGISSHPNEGLFLSDVRELKTSVKVTGVRKIEF